MPLISLQHSKLYKNSRKSTLPPHIFMVADMTHQAMIHNKSPQVGNARVATSCNTACCAYSGVCGKHSQVQWDSEKLVDYNRPSLLAFSAKLDTCNVLYKLSDTTADKMPVILIISSMVSPLREAVFWARV